MGEPAEALDLPDAGCHLCDVDLDWPAWQAAQRARTLAAYAPAYAATDALVAVRREQKPKRKAKAVWAPSLADGKQESMRRGSAKGVATRRRKRAAEAR